MVACGYLTLMMVGMAAFYPDEPSVVFLGILSKPWLEWAIFAIVLFTIDTFVIPRYKSILEEK